MRCKIYYNRAGKQKKKILFNWFKNSGIYFLKKRNKSQFTLMSTTKHDKEIGTG